METPNPRALLLAEIGSVTTRVILADVAEGETRLVVQVEVPSSIEPPPEDASRAFMDAATRIEALTGRKLVSAGKLIMPQTNERDGVGGVVATTSASGMLRVVIAAVAADLSARSALRAIRAVPSSVLQVVTLDDTNRGDTREEADTSWIERQVQVLSRLNPDAVLLVGGIEEGVTDPLVRLAHIIGLTALNVQFDMHGQVRQDVHLRPVVFAGNSAVRERVVEALSTRADLRMTANLLPTLEHEFLDPTRRELIRIYNDVILPQLPGRTALEQLCDAPLRSSIETAGLMVRFIAERYGRNVLLLDVGATTSSALLYAQDRYSPMVRGDVGVGYGVGTVLAERGVEQIARWLPFGLDERDLTNRLLNKMLRPQIEPTTREDVLIEQAVAREVLSLMLEHLWDERRGASYDLVIAGGGVLTHAPHPGMAALMILDALQPSAAESVLAVELHLDTFSLMTICGALAFTDADAALTLFERDLLRNTPLATCVVALGDGSTGEPAVDAELTIAGEGTRTITVQHGQIGRLPLPPGKKGQLRLRPAAKVRIGRNAAGAEVASDVAAISGSALGVLIDARGRPLVLPSSFAERQQRLWDWLVALEAEHGPLPYDVWEAPVLTPSASTPRVSTTRSSTPVVRDLPPEEAVTLDNDMARLRQTVTEPKKKRGLFQRK